MRLMRLSGGIRTALDLEVEPPPGIRRESLIVKDVPESVLQEGRQDYDKWRAGSTATIASGSAPSVSVRTATEWAATAETITADDRAASVIR